MKNDATGTFGAPLERDWHKKKKKEPNRGIHYKPWTPKMCVFLDPGVFLFILVWVRHY